MLFQGVGMGIRLGAVVLVSGSLVGCGLTTGGEATPSSGPGPSGGSAAEEAEGGAAGLGDGVEPRGGAALGGNAPAQAGGAASPAAGGETAQATAIVFSERPGNSEVFGTAEMLDLHGVALIDGSATWAEQTTTENELCVSSDLQGEDFRLSLGGGYYDAIQHGVTGFAFDFEVDPPEVPATFSVGAYFDGMRSFRGKLAGHNAFRFSDLGYDTKDGRVILDANYQHKVHSLSWFVGDNGTVGPVRFCIRNLVALRD